MLKRSDFERWLAEGDLTTDGRSSELAKSVLESPSYEAFTTTWAMDRLSIIARLYPEYQAKIVGEISKFKHADLSSVRYRTEKSLKIVFKNKPFPRNRTKW